MDEETTGIEELYLWDFPDWARNCRPSGGKSYPEATKENMVVLMDKINELIKVINDQIK